MAWIFDLAAEFGDDHVAASEFARFFDHTRWRLQTEPSFETEIRSGVQAGETGRWWALATPSGVSRTGGSTPEEVGRMTEIGFCLYEKLRSAPPYRFAAVGVEVFDFRDVEDLPEIVALPQAHGLVLSEALWMAFGRPPMYVPFSDGYWWMPFRGVGLRD